MLIFIMDLIRGLWPLWIILILLIFYKIKVRPASLKNVDHHDWSRILYVIQQKQKKWSNQLPVEINAKITNIIMNLSNFVPKINKKYSETLIASEINNFMIQLFELVEKFFSLSPQKRNADIKLLAAGLDQLSNRIQKVVATYDKGEENEFIAVIKQITGEKSLEA